jgi:hypothetical protein
VKQHGMARARTATADCDVGGSVPVNASSVLSLTSPIMSGLSPPNIKLPLSIHTHRRGRSSSFLKVEHVDSSNEVALDQAAYANNNAEWVNRKGVCSFRG